MMIFDLTSQKEKNYILGARNGHVKYYGPIEQQIPIITKKNGAKFACFNYINCIIGSGIVGIPFALKEAGFGAGLLLLIGVAFITDYSLRLMIKCAHLRNTYTYQGIMESAFGRPGFILLSVLQLVYPFTAMISYNIIVGDTLPKVLISLFDLPVTSTFVRRDFVIGVSTLLTTVPLCLRRDLVGLTKTSTLSFFLIIIIIVIVFVRMATLSGVVPRSADAFNFMNPSIFTAFGVMAFAFMCHHNAFLLYDSIEEANQSKWNKVTHVSVAISTFILALFGIAGYITFTGYTEGDIFQNYCWNDSIINMARLAFAFTVLFAFPIECMTARSVIRQFIPPIDVDLPSKEHIVISLALVLSTYLISITTNCLGIVLELNGIISAIPLAFVLPALIYIKLEEGPLTSTKKKKAAFLALFGCTAAIIGSVQLFIYWNSYLQCTQSRQWSYCEYH